MSNADDEQDLQPTFHEGKSNNTEELAKLDNQDESLNRWKAALGVRVEPTGTTGNSGPQLTVFTLFLTLPTLPEARTVSIDLTSKARMEDPIKIKEDVTFKLGIKFRVHYDVVSGIKYHHIVKRTGITIDRMDETIGSYGPHPQGEDYIVNLPEQKSPSGILGRGTYTVRSRILDDDGTMYADFNWAFQITQDW